MKNTKTKLIDLPNIQISEEELNDVTMINPIDFISEEENAKIIERVKDGLRNINNPNRWLTCEEFTKLAKERFNL